MFNNLGKLKYKNSKSIFRINISNLNEGINNLDNYIILKKNRKIIVYNRICDHAGGKIITKDEKFYCPIHNWQFNPKTGKYNNGYKKEPIKYYLKENYLIINDLISKPNIGRKSSKHNKTNIRFFNHAFLKISGHNFSFCIDPWAIGPAFHTGWWLKNKTKDDWVEEVNKSDFIYISHNHPDHLHGLTLSNSKKNPRIKKNELRLKTGKNVIIEKNVKIGKNVTIGHNSVIRENTIIGNNVIIGCSSTIGGIGFGYTKNEKGNYEQIYHSGNVIINDDVEIGNSTNIEKASIGSTIIGKNCKIGHLVSIGHSCKISENCIITTFANISGSCEIGKNVWIGPKANLLQKMKVGNNSLIGMSSVVIKSVPSNSTVFGFPAKVISK